MRADEAPAQGTPVLELERVTVRYGTRLVLDDIDLAFGSGQFVGVIGANGAGKTTLLRTILGLVTPTAGRVLIAGQPARAGSRLVGYVPQSFDVEPDMPVTARDIVALGVDGERWGIPWNGRERRRRVDAMLERVGASHYANQPVGRLSGGERQRLLVAQALLTDPRILLLDEPLASLDLGSTQEIVGLVKDIADERHVTVLLVAHDMNPLLPIMDGVIYLAQGHAAVGTVDEVVRPDVLTRLYGRHVDVVRVHGRVLVVGSESRDPASPEHAAHGHHEAGEADR